ncbi:MAG: TonB-dependent receptor [Xanthomonadales bacterium]|nr:TonB-dependent receptor [Xanthomonadales bacterium]
MNQNNYRRQKLALACMIALAANAQAQSDSSRERSDEDEARQLDTVIVTVERREQDLQKYAGTAQSLSQDELRGLGINNELRNIQWAIPGMSIANQEGNVEIFIRGVGSANNTELGDPGAAPHINGMYVPRPRGLGAMFYDLDRVEVNKGPQGTLRGRNALAGTLNIVTRRPDLGEVNGYVLGEAGSRDHLGGEFGLNLPVGERAAFRVAGYWLEKDSSFRNVGDQSLKAAGFQDEKAARVSFLAEPTDALSIFLMADIGKEGGTGYPGANIFGAAVSGFRPEDLDMRRVVYTGPQGELDATNWGVQAKIGYDFGAVRLDYGVSYRDVDYWQVNASSQGIDWPGRDLTQRPPGSGDGSRPDYDLYSSNYWESLSQAQIHELLLTSSDEGRFLWTVGGFHFDEDQKAALFSLADKGVFYSGTEFTMPEVRGRSWAVFGDGTYELNESFRLKGGLRYTDEFKSRYGIGGNWTIGLGAENGCCFSTRLGTPGFRPALSRRPNFDVSGLTTNADYARFLLEGILRGGINDTIFQQIGPIASGTLPNGGCVARPDTGGNTLLCSPNGSHPWIVLGIPSQQVGESKFDFVDWRVGFEYDASPDNLVYGTLSTGHKAGGFNDSFDPDVIPETYRPESILAWEIGSKNAFQLWGRRSTFNVSAFYYDYKDQVFQDLTAIAFNPDTGEATGFALVNRNVGKSRIMGVEAESMLNFSRDFSLQLHGLYLDTEIKRGVVADVRSIDYGLGGVTSEIDLAGNELPLASRLTLNARLQHAFDLGPGTFDWQVLASYRSGYYLTQFNNRDVVFVADTGGTVDRIESAAEAGFPDRQRGETTLNVGIGYGLPGGAWRIEAWGSNLLGNDVSQKALVGSQLNIRFLNDPRTYGVRVKAVF